MWPTAKGEGCAVDGALGCCVRDRRAVQPRAYACRRTGGDARVSVRHAHFIASNRSSQLTAGWLSHVLQRLGNGALVPQLPCTMRSWQHLLRDQERSGRPTAAAPQQQVAACSTAEPDGTAQRPQPVGRCEHNRSACGADGSAAAPAQNVDSQLKSQRKRWRSAVAVVRRQAEQRARRIRVCDLRVIAGAGTLW